MPAIPGNGSTRRLRPIEPVLTSTWRRVEALAPREMLDDDQQDEWEEEDEVEYVTLEFGSHLSEDVLNRYGELQLLGAESAHPIARVGHKHFQGVHETLIGNDLLFSYQPDGTPAYVPYAKSSHRITFQPVRITRNPQKAEGDATPQPTAGSDAGDDSDGVPRGTGSGRGRGRGRGRGKKAAEPPALGPDGQPIKRKPGRPKGSKNKNPRKSIPLGPPPQVDDDDDLYGEMALPVPPESTEDDALPMLLDAPAEAAGTDEAAS